MDKLEKYKQCLDEIKDYCRNAIDLSQYGDTSSILASFILQKIKQAKEGK